ncbi:acyl carrier protein [Streptomyces geranii]|uniref:acyl carrier protein n=1 Tax=Streptomyces geranii TaxID=2058923 RepID=UPI001E2BBF5D|nr:phosphopantetheine-binding protein [Streptomyces geranii]
MSIDKTLRKILVDDLFVSVPQAEIGLDDGLRDILGLDSLGFTELRTQCEYAFDITISDEDFVPENFSTVRDLARLVTRLSEPVPDEVGSR